MTYNARLKMTTLPPIMRLIGSKTRQRRNILPILARYRRELYVEPFGGAGGLFFGKAPEPAEVYNDKNRAFASLMRCVRSSEKLDVLERLLALTPVSRELWYECKALSYAYMRTEAERFAELKEAAGLSEYADDVVGAFAIFYAQNCGFGGVFLRAFGGGATGKSSSGTVHVYKMRRELLQRYCRRLETVLIENVDALECLDKYDHETTLFYLDPPYITSAPHSDAPEVAYGGCTIDAKELVARLKRLKGRFVLSCYDADEYRELADVAERHEFPAFSSTCQYARKDDERVFERVEVVYASRLPGTRSLF